MENLKIEALKNINEYTDKLIIGIEEVATCIQEGNEIVAMKKIIPVLDGIEYIINGITLTQSIQKEKIELGDLNRQLNDILEAFTNEDHILIGDLLNYELVPIIEEIKNKLELSIK